MVDREKLIKGLKCCADWQRGSMHRFCEVCPYNDNPVMQTCNNLFPLFRDVLTLLKADQAQLVEQRKRLETIADIAYDYDGYKMEEDLKALIDEIRDIALWGVPENWGGQTMIDRGKVIKGLKCCADVQHAMYRDCDDCPYNNNLIMGTCDTLFPLFRDALALLKADQEHLAGLIKRLETIADIAFDYDGYRTAEDLMSLIDEMRDIALRGVPEEVDG